MREATLHSRVDVPKLRVAVRMVPPRLRLPVALETVVEPVQELGHLRMADRMGSSTEFGRKRPRTLTNPPQGRFRIAPRLMIELNDELLRAVKREAAKEQTTLRAVVERALRAHLAAPAKSSGYVLKWRTEHGRLQPDVKLDDRDALFDLMEGRE